MAIIKVPRSDDTSAFVLLNIEPSSDHSLTAKVVGTDGVGAFVLPLKPALADRARGNKASCTPAEWTSILKSILLDGLTPQEVEVTATVEDEANIQVVFRKTFEGGLKQRLGSLTLKYDENEAIELLDWCATLATHASEQAKALENEQRKVRKLVQETQELVKAKEEAETEVIGKCLRLVNSKKEKIQELQQRLSRCENGDPPIREPLQVEQQVEEEEAPQPAKRGRGKAAAKGKGKARAASPAETTLPRRGKRAPPDREPEEEEEEEEGRSKEEGGNADDVDMEENEVETEGETEGEDTPSDHSVEDEVPEVRTRADSQSRSQSRSQKNTSPPKEAEHEAPHVTTRSHDQRHKKGAAEDDGSETESDDEL